jgi:hypothetical protein
MRNVTPILGILITGTMACGVSKQVHCNFVNNVGRASQHYEEAAQQAGNEGWKAEASELKKTVESEQALYCK